MTETENTEINGGRRGQFFIPGPAIALLSFAQSLTGTVLTDLIVYRTCLVSLGINDTECSILRTNSTSPEANSLEKKIEPYVSTIVMARSLIESLLPAVVSLFLGPWSDRGGRRPIFLANFIGFTLTYIMFSLISNWNVSPWYLLIPSFPAQITAGSHGAMMASYCYITDTTEEKERTMLLVWLDATVVGGILLGIFSGPLIYENYGYSFVFGTAVICCVLGLLYTYFYIPETVKDTSKESICGLFKISLLNEVVTSSFTKRDGFHRPVVWLAMSILTLCVMVFRGESSIEYIFTRARLGWDIQHYSYFNGGNTLLNVLGMLGGVSLLGSVLGLSDTLIAGMGLLSALGGAITRSLTFKAWHMYLSSAIGSFGVVLGPVLRSIISRSVPEQDVGKVFSLLTLLEATSALGGTAIYTQIYSHNLPPIYPAPVYLISTGFHVALTIFLVYLEMMIKKLHNSSYVTLAQNDC